MQTFAHSLAIATTVLTVAGMAWCFVVLIAAFSFRLSIRKHQSAFTPGVSILKPVKGLDPGMLEAFRSHCRQSYSGDYEILFGAGSEDDPAVPAIRQLIAEFPERPIQIGRAHV